VSGSELRLVVSVQARGVAGKPRERHPAGGAVMPGVRAVVTSDLPGRVAAVEDARRRPVPDHRTPPPGPAPTCPVVPACVTGP
jgi:hypothetical protein